MSIFLSYAAEQRDVAEQIKLALAVSGHDVFFDRDSLPAGDEYHHRIRRAVENCDVLVFLVSPRSVEPGCYALTELKYGREKWPVPRGKVLPVMAKTTEYEQIPPYLKAVSVLEPQGNAAAEVAAEIRKLGMKDFRGLVQFGTHTLKGNVARFLAVMSRPRAFIASIDHGSERGLIDACAFAALISAVHLVILAPSYKLAGVRADSWTYLVIDTVITFAFWFVNGSLYHIVARLAGGRGSYVRSIVAYLCLTAFTLVSGIFILPASLTVIPWGLQSSDVPSLDQFRMLGDSLVQSPSFLTGALLSSAVTTYRWICTVGRHDRGHECPLSLAREPLGWRRLPLRATLGVHSTTSRPRLLRNAKLELRVMPRPG